MKFETKLKYRGEEWSPQVKFLNGICHSRTQINNEILNEIEVEKLLKTVADEIFYNMRHNRTQIINEILNETKIQERRKTAAGEIFNRI